jgi:hypothetical protein
MASPTTFPRALGTLEGKDLVDEYIFYDAKGEEVHVLNGIAREIFLLCDGERSVDDLVKNIVDRYEVDEETARRDISELLQNLVDLKLVGLS